MQARDGFVKKSLPCVAHNAHIVQEFLHLIAELVGLHRADTLEYRGVAGEVGVLAQQRVKVGILQRVQLQREKDQRGGEICDLLLHIGHEFRATRVCRQLVIAQTCVGHDAPCDLVDLLVAQHALQQTCGVECSQFPFVISRKAGAGLLQPVQIALELGGVLGGVEVVEVPFGQVAEVGFATRGICVADREREGKHG